MARTITDLPTPTPQRYEGMHTTRDGLDDSIASELADVVGGEVRFDDGSRATYSTDASNYRQVPIGVVVPRTIEDVAATVAVCRAHDVPITSRGGGTSLAGQACNEAVVIDYSKYLNRVISIDPEARTATVEPGCVLDDLREAAAEHGLTFGPDPATHDRNTLGGMLGNNSCGAHSVMSEMYGPGPMTVHQVVEMEVLTYDGSRFTVGAHDTEELAEIVANGADPRSEVYGRLSRLREDYRAQIQRGFPDIPRRVSGYNLDWLLEENGFDVAKALVGTEGTCVLILSATVRLIEAIPERTLVVAGYPDAASAADDVPSVREHRPVALEGIDRTLVDYMKKKGLHPDDVEMLPEGDGWLLVEFGGETAEQSHRRAEDFVEAMSHADKPTSIEIFDDEWEVKKIWQVRESGLGATAHVPGVSRTHPGWEDAAVPPGAVGEYLREFQTLLDEFDYHAALYGHFGQGCVHCRIDFDFSTDEGVDTFADFIDRAADLVIGLGGSLSGEHGDGQARAALLSKMYGDDLVAAFRRFKAIWDPERRMNPGKVVDPYSPTDNLRQGPDRQPVEVKTHFSFADDGGSFASATARCVGVGKCRDVRSGTMCPSYMATREEEDSTRGRARLLYEMLQGSPIDDVWESEEVREALDLCLACKGCKTECPVNVDMATYKAEFLSHHYEGRVRPRVAYSMGLIYWWARLATHMPRLANFLSSRRPTSTLLKKAAGVATARDIPGIAPESLRSWFEGRATTRTTSSSPSPSSKTAGSHDRIPRFTSPTYTGSETKEGATLNPVGEAVRVSSDRVMLWPDTFNNYLEGGAGRSAVRVLESAGLTIDIPRRPMCCGRPLYDWGMLDRAKNLWSDVLEAAEPWIDEGIPLVGLEPSCVASFRDELPALFPDDPRALALSEQTYLFSEYLARQDIEIPKLARDAIVQGHCHHKAVMHMDAEVDVLDDMGLDYEILDSGCCGMAGAFGFDADNYEVSMRVGERVLLPRVRDAAPETLVVANGFSCRQQIEQSTDRRALHLAEVIELAMEFGETGPPGGYPEDAIRSQVHSSTKGNAR